MHLQDFWLKYFGRTTGKSIVSSQNRTVKYAVMVQILYPQQFLYFLLYRIIEKKITICRKEFDGIENKRVRETIKDSAAYVS